jgi:hypothetical protein
MTEWDGNDYQFWARACLATVMICYTVAAFKAGVDELFIIAIIFGLVGIALVPKGPKPPS